MYTQVERRSINLATIEETIKRAQAEFFPKIQAAGGFVGFYLVTDEKENVNTAVVVWDSKEAAEAFKSANSAWLDTLEGLGHKLQSTNEGETAIELQPAK